MKIKTDFVTNSSSTSFILVVRNQFDKNTFLQSTGVLDNSNLAFMFENLYYKIKESMDELSAAEIQTLSPSIKEKAENALQTGGKVYSGSLSSDVDDIATFFCTDSFIIESDDIYLNYIECVW